MVILRILRFLISAAMNRSLTTSQRVVKPGVKKRRPPLACIQCYQRKLKCGRELPSCSRCSKAGNADYCTYRGNKGRPTSVDGLFNDGPSGVANGAAASSCIENSSTETRGRHATSAIQEVDMSHLEGQGNCTKFYGYSYPLNLYQQMLLVAATAASYHPGVCIDAFSHKTTHDHVVKWVEVAEAWVSSQSNQPPRSWDILVSHSLLLIAKRANFIKEGSLWTSSGALVRWAMAAGYHREVVSAARIPPFCREMRRRLWVTIVELDLQASIERGMPPSVRIGDFNVKPPLNVDDESLEESIQDSLAGMPITTLTNTSFQALLYRSLPVRLRICAFINGCCEEADFDKVLELEEESRQAFRDIPTFNNPQADPRQHQTATYIKSMLGIVLHQYMLLLHFHFLVQTPSSSKALICRRARLEASMKILDYYQRLLNDEALPEQACRTGLILAALNICHEIDLNNGSQGCDQSTITIFPEISTFLVAKIEKVLEILEKRISLTFNGLNEYYITRQAAIRQEQPFPDACEDSESRGNQLSIDANYMGSDIMTDLISSMLPQDLDFINDNLDLTFFHA
ncbi:hypothetical protein FOC1_g10011805 [Fusarium oxysporum f. sp. cubense race 1]|uniref:Zn(2)-C6 fungal-type domain-containing protein n=1 Tax=Fusarium oxysporum f. sp. cubense (strain race 1) TaxID=1229664 RepID=N4UDK2_FUSC1|nr:hypothetical protein FOC1_g10011805 [Fusarium oxysporum f. sp. cubense race 1]